MWKDENYANETRHSTLSDWKCRELYIPWNNKRRALAWCKWIIRHCGGTLSILSTLRNSFAYVHTWYNLCECMFIYPSSLHADQLFYGFWFCDGINWCQLLFKHTQLLYCRLPKRTQNWFVKFNQMNQAMANVFCCISTNVKTIQFEINAYIYSKSLFCLLYANIKWKSDWATYIFQLSIKHKILLSIEYSKFAMLDLLYVGMWCWNLDLQLSHLHSFRSNFPT